MPNSETRATRALIERLFAAYERGDARQLFDHVADDVHWTITGKNPLSGEYRSKREFLEAAYERLAAVLEQPVRPRVRRIITEGDLAVVEWHGHATSIVEKPYDNDYCWVIRVAGNRIVEVTAYNRSTMSSVWVIRFRRLEARASLRAPAVRLEGHEEVA